MNRIQRCSRPTMWLTSLLMGALLAACGGGTDVNTKAFSAATMDSSTAASAPTQVSSSPSDGATNVSTSTNASNNVISGTVLKARFSEAMDPSTLNSSPAATQLTFTLKESTGNDVPGTVAMNAANTVASFTPSAAALLPNTRYTATISTAAKSAGGTAMDAATVWSFTTSAIAFTAQAPVDLGSAGNFVILAKSGISTVPNSVLTGDIGVSPIAGTAFTGFSETTDASATFAKSPQVVGKMYAADYAMPTPGTMTSAIGDLEIAYRDAAGRSLPDFTELGDGQIGGLTLAPGLYKWGTNVSIASDVTLSGGPNDIWIFQISGNIEQAAATRVTLAGGALPSNVFWQSTGATAIGQAAHFEGVLLSRTLIALKTGASANGRLLAQTAVTLDQNTVTQPAQ